MILAVLTKSEFIAFFLAPTIGENPSSGRSGVGRLHQGVSLSHATVMDINISNIMGLRIEA
jgi:hypothetical protein